MQQRAAPLTVVRVGVDAASVELPHDCAAEPRSEVANLQLLREHGQRSVARGFGEERVNDRQAMEVIRSKIERCCPEIW